MHPRSPGNAVNEGKRRRLVPPLEIETDVSC